MKVGTIVCTLLPVWEARDYFKLIWEGITTGHRSNAPTGAMSTDAMKRAQSQIPLKDNELSVPDPKELQK